MSIGSWAWADDFEKAATTMMTAFLAACSQNSSKRTMRSLIALLLGSLWAVKARESENLLSFPLQYRPPSEDIISNTRRRLQENGDGYANRYEGYGVHFIDLFIGNPSQKRTLAVQTASDHTAFACEVRFVSRAQRSLVVHLSMTPTHVIFNAPTTFRDVGIAVTVVSMCITIPARQRFRQCNVALLAPALQTRRPVKMTDV
jgi:hypothetical protein